AHPRRQHGCPRRPPPRHARRRRRARFMRRRRARKLGGRAHELPRLLRGRAAACAGCAALPSRAMIVAIDGPAGSGKSTVARALAARLDFHYLDTGAMYRALTWLAQREGVDLADGDALGRLARAHPVSFPDDTVEIAGEDVTEASRDASVVLDTTELDVDEVVERIAALVEEQRA